jgi:predicted ATPase/DNA-binding SARP family transcriptional activator
VRFGLLGPLAVWTTDGRAVGVPEVKVRALLANLLVQEGRAISADKLAEDLWGDRPPGNPVNTLQTKVSQLRRTLEKAEPGSRELVVHQAPGYLLRTDAVDALRFRALARQAKETEDSQAKISLLSDALALWRGPALAEFADESFAAPAIQRLEEERLVALEERAEARLALGEHSGLVGELGDLVGRDPLRERLRGLQLRALYRAGRQTEALESYSELRARLAEELGLEPGPELTALHQAILKQDPALDGPAPPARPRTNLPAPLTELVGRDAAVRSVGARVGEARLVTLIGPGGVGKTRLAVETATRLAPGFRDGAWLVELAGLDRQASPESSLADWAVEAAAAALGIHEDHTAGPLAERLVDALRTKEILLVLDNCEQLVAPMAELAARWLRAAPGLRILATSQDPLGLTGEALWPVPPLDVPGEAVTDVRDFSAVRLFVARAADKVPGFTLDTGNAAAVAAICRRLDGIPLALELAATKVRVLGVPELLSRLRDRFRLLSSGNRGAPPRQRTLRAMIDWSWELLTDAERIVLRRLAVHGESCALEAAEAVCAGDGVAAEDVLEILARLVDRSLVVVDGTRYRLLESVALYCIERLKEAGEFEELHTRHYGYYLALAERAETRLRGPDQRQWLERLDAETANLRSALDGLRRRNAAEPALRLVNALSWYWYLRGKLGEAHRSLTDALAIEGEAPAIAKARAACWQAGMAILLGEEADLMEQATQALKLFDDVDDPGGRARAEWFLSMTLAGSGDLIILRERLDSALAGFLAIGDRWGLAAALNTRAGQARPRGELEAAMRDARQSAKLFRELGDRWGQLKATDVLSSLSEIMGDYPAAARLHEEALRAAEELGLWIEVSYELSGLGRIALLRGEFAEADEYHRRALRIAAERSHKRGEQFAEVGLGLGARRQGRLDDAERHLLKWLDWCRRMDGDLGVALIMAELGFVAEQRGDAESALARHLEGLAAARNTGDPRTIALALEGLAGAQALAGRHDSAARLLGTARATRESVGAPLPEAERGDVDRITAAASKALGETTFSEQFARGGNADTSDARLLVAS